MRTIKFRAWYKKEKQMCYPGEDPEFDQGYWDGMYMSEIFMLNRCLELDRIELMQYTGLKDKNGTEIYEGDVVQVKYKTSSWGRKINYNFVGQIKFGLFLSHEKEGCFDEIEGWYISVSPHGQKESLGNHDYASEVIGNIHEHPELLGAKTEV